MSDRENSSIAFIVSQGGERLDYQLSQVVDGLNRRRARELCEKRLVLVNGKPKAPGYILKLNDRVQCGETIGFERSEQVRSSLPLCIVYEDAHLLVVEKPRGLHSVVQRSNDAPTLADSIVAHYPPSKECSKDSREAGLVQRLDFYTSGLLLAAKSLEIWDKLHNLLINERIQKSYLALVQGQLPQGGLKIDYPILMPKGSNKVVVQEQEADEPGSAAVTQAEVIQTIGNDLSLVRAQVKRGRRHQVRAHLAAVGHPLVGDELYGSEFSLSNEIIGLKMLEGFLLHAESLAFVHPVSGEPLEFKTSSQVIDGLFNKD